MLYFSTLKSVFVYLGVVSESALNSSIVSCSAEKFLNLFTSYAVQYQYAEHENLLYSLEHFDRNKIRRVIDHYFVMPIQETLPNEIDDLVSLIHQSFHLTQTEKNIIKNYYMHYFFQNQQHQQQPCATSSILFQIKYAIDMQSTINENHENENENTYHNYILTKRLSKLAYDELNMGYLFMMVALRQPIRIQFIME